MNFTKKAFSIIEVLIGIFIFTLGIASIYMLIISSLNTNAYNKNQIIASNLAREGLELVRNIRDSNYKTFHHWNIIPRNGYEGIDYTDISNYFQTGAYYKIENNYLPIALFPIKVEKIDSFFEGISELNGKMKDYELCLDNYSKYYYCNPSDTSRTRFYRYIKIEELKDKDGVINNAYKVTSKVIFYVKGYHEFELSTILADFKRL